jgi:adenosylcobinamide-phosphate synthase
MAGALDVHLGGPASYDGVAHDRAVFGQGRRADVADLRRGLRIYVSACGLMWLTLGVGAVLWPR